MNFCKPEQAGISSKNVLNFYKKLESYNLSTHSVILARGNDVFSEAYYEPFSKDYMHRMYSITKSFVSLAIGFCEQDGLINLDDKMVKYFEEFVNEKTDEKMLNTTIRDMLRMQSSQSYSLNWFTSNTKDRQEVYFQKSGDKNPGTLYHYDSPGSYMLGVIVEKITGKPFIEYLKEKCFNEIGFSKNAYCLKAPGGYSWGDSGLMCTARDLLLVCRLLLNKGTFNGKRYLNEEYINKATDTNQVSNDYFGFKLHGTFGYGYQFWGCPMGCYAMFGMGNQIALCDPKHDFIFIINSDNQGNGFAYEQILECVYTQIITKLRSKPLKENQKDYEKLVDYTSSRKLFSLKGKPNKRLINFIENKTYVCEENPCKIKWLKFNFNNDVGELNFENEQGVKVLKFGLSHNQFGKFPQYGYSDMIGTVSEPNNRYDCMASANFACENSLRIRVQIIDKYFGNLSMFFTFKKDGTLTCLFSKLAEAFLNEYEGIINAKVK